MSVSIIACPSCKTLLLPDTAQCPTCNHVLDESRKGSIPATKQVTAAAQSPSPEPAEDEIVCPGCRELVKRGLVRCWNCGSFMREDIAESYQRMQSSPAPVIYSDVQDADAEVEDGSKAFDADASVDPLSGDDVDFELSPDVQASDAGDDEFQLSSQEDDDIPPPAAESTRSNGASEALKSPVATQPQPPASTSAPAADATASQVAHEDSVHEFENEFENAFGEAAFGAATGDALLQVALAEEAEIAIRRRAAMSQRREGKRGILVFCPNGHRVEVQERHRGLTGRCPKCRESFAVPKNPWEEAAAQEQADESHTASRGGVVEPSAGSAMEESEISAGEYTHWMTDVHLHVVNVGKLKLTPGSLAKTYQEVDFAFSPDGLLVMTLAKGGGLFGGGDKKKESAREAVLDHLSKGKSRDGLPAAEHRFFKPNQIQEICVVQPIVSDTESMFAGVHVFGDGRIAIRFPKQGDATEREFASLTISEFRNLASILEEQYGIERLGEDAGVPLADEYTERHCHFSDQPLQVLNNLAYYEIDPAVELVVIGRSCQECGLVMSEESRENENFGGKNARGIAKAKCPGCGKRFGNVSIYAIKTAETPAAEEPAAST